PRPLLSLQKAGASSTHSKRWRAVHRSSARVDAKRLECVRLAGALASPATTVVPPKSGSKLHALQTLARWSSILGPRSREAFGVRPACQRFGIARDHCCPSKKRSKLHALQTLARVDAKRLECVRLAGALASPATIVVPPKSGSKLHALQTLARSVCSVSGLPALSYRPRPLLSPQNAEQAP